MKKLIFIVLASLSSGMSFADVSVEKFGPFDVYSFSYKGVQTVSAVVTYEEQTKDGCNNFSLEGAFRKIDLPNEVPSDYVQFHANFSVIHTELTCRDLVFARMIRLKSQKLEIPAIHGNINGSILVPASMTLLIQEI